MLNSIHLKNLTVFVNARIEFSQLNIIIGENSVGKTHLLKVPYSILAVSAKEGIRPNVAPPTKSVLQSKLAEKLVAVLRPEKLGRLARRRQGQTRCEIACRFTESKYNIEFSFATNSESAVSFDKDKNGMPTAWVNEAPVFLPTHELLTINPNSFVSFYDRYYLGFDETWRDTCLLLMRPVVRGPREKSVQELIEPLEQAMNGKVELDTNTGRSYLIIPTGRMEMPLVAEGLRKFAMLARLIANGSLLDRGYLFWDEPDANLNPKLIKQCAKTILNLCMKGIQVFIATHSLFLLREFEILRLQNQFESLRARFIGLQPGSNGVVVEQGNRIEDIGTISTLEEELNQTDRFLNSEDSANDR